MKRTLFLIPILLFILNGCEKLSKLTQITVPYSSQITVPASTNLITVPYPFSTPPITTNTETTMKNNGFTMSLIQKVSLKKIDIVLNSPSDGNLDYLNEIKIYIEADGLQKTLIAQKNVPSSPSGLTNLSLDCVDTDLKDFFKKDSFKITTEITTDKIIVKDQKIDINCNFMIDVNVLGL